jgi:nucleoside-diphosphate-sugar epimerase
MRVLVSGASGAIGRFLIPQLADAGHEVVGLTRHQAKAGALAELGARGVVVEALDREAVRRVVLDVAPDAVIDELTSLPRDYNLRDPHLYDANDEIRSKGTPALHDAAREAGARRFVMQSIAFLYAPQGDWVKDEDAPMWLDAPGTFARSVRVLRDNEQRVTGDPDVEGVVLRYGFFYGPGTYHASDGSIAQQVRKRRLPIVGKGLGMNSFVHLYDAATATVAALERGSGVYNVVDDEPARASEWLPAYAAAIGARAPRRVPVWLARLAARRVAGMANELRGASNAKAKAQLGWQPVLPSWREGFTTALDSGPGLGGLSPQSGSGLRGQTPQSG